MLLRSRFKKEFLNLICVARYHPQKNHLLMIKTLASFKKKYKGKFVGAIGDIGGFSLNYHKHIQTGEGGVLVTNDEIIAQKCRV